MTVEVPQYCLRAYALFYSKFGSREEFKQSFLDWIVSPSMRKKIFSLLLKSGWIKKASRSTYKCVPPSKAISELTRFRVPDLIKKADRKYAFTGLSAVEVWSDYAYVQRGIEKSPYFVRVLKKDLDWWQSFFNKHNIPNYVNKGSNIGEYVILIRAEQVGFVEKHGLKVDSLKKTMKYAKSNDIFLYAYNYMREKYGASAT